MSDLLQRRRELLRLVVSIIQFWVSSYVRADWTMQSTSFEYYTRFMLRVLVKAVTVRVVWREKPLFMRLSASDWAEGPEKTRTGGGYSGASSRSSCQLVTWRSLALT